MPLSPCLSDLDEELASTRRMLERYPDGRGSWRPHPKSRTLGELATHVAGIPRTGLSVITADSFDIAGRKPAPPFDSAAELLAAFDAAAADVRKAAHAASEADLDGTWALRAGDHVIVSGRKRDLVRRMMLSHIIHHRAQLGDYYRLLDVPVPGMYGPTADDAPRG
ncbi:MAG TPA: DinB family protein [Gemmatimonadaceae bacterium]